jgi:hypothetical protein
VLSVAATAAAETGSDADSIATTWNPSSEADATSEVRPATWINTTAFGLSNKFERNAEPESELA